MVRKPPTAWSAATRTGGVSAYAWTVACRLSDQLARGVLDPQDGVSFALRAENAAAITSLATATEPLFSQTDQGYISAAKGGLTRGLTGVIRLADLDWLLTLVGATESLSLVDIGQVLPADALARPKAVAFATFARTSRTTPVVAIIDDGIALGHGRFRHDDGSSRIIAAWAQDGVTPTPFDFAYGREYLKPELDDLIARATGPGGFDDDRFMALSGLVAPRRGLLEVLAYRFAHGTAVLDRFAGYSAGDRDWQTGAPVARDAAAAAPIIAVQFPSAVAHDTSGAALRPLVRDALRYVADRAAKLVGSDAPVVVNLSYELVAGPHNGNHAIERDIAEILDAHPNLHLVLAAGNATLERCHAHLPELPQGAGVSLPWQVLPDDHTPSFAEIWPRGGGTPALAVALESPGGEISAPVQLGSGMRQVLMAGTTEIAAVDADNGAVLLSLAPTRDWSGPAAPMGQWRIHLTNNGTDPLDVDLWVQRDELPYPCGPKGRQSFIDHPAYRRFDEIGDICDRDIGPGPVRREATISAMATLAHPRLHVIGAWMDGDVPRPSLYTAHAVDGGRAPDMAAPGDCSRVHAGIGAAGSRSASAVFAGGTSLAAPQFARRLLNALASGTAPVIADTPPQTYMLRPGLSVAAPAHRLGQGILHEETRAHPPRRMA